MVEITKKDKGIFLEARVDSLLNNLNSRDKIISFLSGGILLVNIIYLYWVFTTTNTDAVLFYLASATVMNLLLWANISSCVQSYQETLDEVILFEHTYSSIRPHYCLQKLEEEFGATDIRIHAKNIAFVMMILYAVGAIVFAKHHGYSILSLFWLA